MKLSEAPDVSGESVRQVEEKADFLVKELDYNTQLQRTLRAIKGVNQLLDEVQQASRERQVLHALHLLESNATPMRPLLPNALTMSQSPGQLWMLCP